MFGLGLTETAIIWSAIMVIAVIMYVILDGFDLGVGMLTRFLNNEKDQNCAINSIAPFWDGNETWLILGGGALLIAFPLAYSIIIQAMYLPILFMLMGLILRGVAFEFIFKSKDSHRSFWIKVFHYGSFTAAFFQGVILGNFVQGFEVEAENFTGSAFAWVSPFCFMVGLAVTAGYVLLGSTWMVWRSEGKLQKWSKRVTTIMTFVVLFFMGVVSLWVPFLKSEIFERWFSLPNFFYLLPVPVFAALTGAVLVYSDFKKTKDYVPFMATVFLFLLGFLGLGVSIWPWIVPHKLTIWDCLGVIPSLEITFIGVAIMLPIVLVYTGFNYYLFRGKVSSKSMYE